MSADIFEQLARCKPVNRQAALVTSGATKPQVFEDDAPTISRYEARKAQQEVFEQAAVEFRKRKSRSLHFLATDYGKCVARRRAKGLPMPQRPNFDVYSGDPVEKYLKNRKRSA